MPTGYTADIAKDISFEQFVWNCARAFGALVLMRDDPADAPIPESFAPSTSYQKWAEEARTRLTALEAMIPSEVEIAAAAAHEMAMASWRKQTAASTELRNKYNAMLSRVVQWTPPTPDHAGLRDFMVQQIQESIRFDCHDSPVPECLEPTAWHAGQLEHHRRMLARYEQGQAEEIERTEGRNRWLKALRESVPMPAGGKA